MEGGALMEPVRLPRWLDQGGFADAQELPKVGASADFVTITEWYIRTIHMR